MGGPKIAQMAEYGGIDLNAIGIKRLGRTIDVRFDPKELNGLIQGGFEGFMPVIMNVTPVHDPLSLLDPHPKSDLVVLR